MPDLNYQVFRNSLGIVDAVNRLSDGATVPLDNLDDPLTIELRKWEAANGALDLSDHPPVVVIPPIICDWQGLENSLRSTDIFAAAFSTTNANAWALLLASLHSNAASDDPGRLADFEFAIAAIRQGLAQDFSADQITRFNALLAQHGFPFQVS